MQNLNVQLWGGELCSYRSLGGLTLCVQNQVKHRFMAQEIQVLLRARMCVHACIKMYIYMNIKKLNGNSNSIYIIDFITMAFSSNK
jgi:hypothetical protein